jgi:hypothetical protein
MSIKNTAATRGRLRSVATLDWLLIYRKETEQLFLERTGSHSELFKKKSRTLQQMLFEIDGTGGAVAFFRKKMVGMARRAVRILQRSPRDLVPR